MYKYSATDELAQSSQVTDTKSRSQGNTDKWQQQCQTSESDSITHPFYVLMKYKLQYWLQSSTETSAIFNNFSTNMLY